MLFEFVFMYMFVDAFCLFFSAVIYSKITIEMGAEREIRALRGLVVAFMLFLAADAVWALGSNGVLPMTAAATGIMEASTLLLMGFVAWCWFLFVEYKLNAPYSDTRWFVPVSAVPIAVVVLLYATTRFTGLIYTIGPDASFADGPIAILPEFLFLAYVAYATAHALARFARERSSVRKGEIISLVWFAIPPTVCGILDLFVHGMPIMALSTFAAMLLVFMNSQDSRINTDALTGLNNRRRAVGYIEDSLDSLSPGEVFGVIMVDVDYFKSINDEHGHGEGDHALQLIAEGLRLAVDGHHGLAARWGGDEFLVATHLGSADRVALLEEGILRAIADMREREGVDYDVSVSMGHALAREGDELAELVAKADKMLYEQKAEHHAAEERKRDRSR